MAGKKTSRSSNDGKAWKCRCGTLNNPTKYRFFKLPAFQCSNCGRKLSLDFKFCLGEIEVGEKSLTGEVLDQKQSPFCVAFAYAKVAEITERVFAMRNGIDPDSVVPIHPLALEKKFLQNFPNDPSHNSLTRNRGVLKVLHTGLILRSEGCIRVKLEDEPYKASDVSTVPRDSFELICQDLAQGIPFVGTYLAGKRRGLLPYCKVYKSPRLSAIEAKKGAEIGHAVVIIGAGMKKGKKYFYFLNSWGNKFCPRKNRKGETVRGGIGKVRVEDLTKNLVKLSPPDEIGGGERSLQNQSEYDISKVNYILMMATKNQYSAQMLQDLRGETNSEFVASDHVDDGIFRDDEGGVRPQTCYAKSQALKVIKKLIEHFPIKRAPLRVQFTAPKLNFTGLMEKFAQQNATVISKDESGTQHINATVISKDDTQPSIACDIEPSILHPCEERLKDVQGRVEVRSVSAHAEGGPSVEKHGSVDVPQASVEKLGSVDVPQAAPAKEPDAVAHISETIQKQSISTDSQGSAQGKQQGRCKELNFTGPTEKVTQQNATVISKDESGTQPPIVCETGPSILHSCEDRLKDVQGRVEVRSVSAHAEGDLSVEQHDSVEVPQVAPATEPDAVAQISETMRKQSLLLKARAVHKASSRGARSVMCSWRTSYTESSARVCGTSTTTTTHATRTGSPLCGKRTAWWRWNWPAPRTLKTRISDAAVSWNFL